MKSVHKKITAILGFILVLIAAFTLTACASGDKGFHAPSGSFGGDVFEEIGNSGGQQKPIKKQLTAAEWRDALDYKFWLGLFEQASANDEQENEEQTPRNGIFYDYSNAPRGLDTFDMHEIDVTCNGSPIAGTKVTLYNENNIVYSAVSDSAGKAYVFGNGTRVNAVSGEFNASAGVTDAVTNIELTNYAACDNELEIMLVVDTTGSMYDELSFLCNELAGVVTRVSSTLDCDIRLGLLFYRDKEDEYITRKYDFIDVTSSNGLNTVVKRIKEQKAKGGGDYPEAVDTALSEAVAVDWHENSKTKLLFHVLDAPYHDEQEIQGKFSGAVKTAAQKGIRIIPIAASGLDTLGQYIMRSAALLTGGTYTFLTDDSGIGNSHELPDVGEFTVEYLSDLMVRIIKGYHVGIFDEPVPWTQSSSVA